MSTVWSYNGVANGVNIREPSGIYGIGFGPGDLRTAREAGYSDTAILEHLETSYIPEGHPVPASVLTQLRDGSRDELDNKATNPWYQLVGATMIREIAVGGENYRERHHGWIDNIIREAYVLDDNTPIHPSDYLSSREDVHNLIGNTGWDYWAREFDISSYQDGARSQINEYSRFSPRYNNYQPTVDRVNHSVPPNWGALNDTIIPDRPDDFDYDIANPTTAREQGLSFVGNVGIGRDDYRLMLTKVVSTAGIGAVAELREARLDFIDAMDRNPAPFVWDHKFNATLRDVVRPHAFTDHALNWSNDRKNGHLDKMTSFFGYYQGTEKDLLEQERRFGPTDVLAMKAAGFDDMDIYHYMKTNLDKGKTVDGVDIPGSEAAYNEVRDRLIARYDTFLTQNTAGGREGWDDHWEKVMLHPRIREIGEHMLTLDAAGERGMSPQDRLYNVADMQNTKDWGRLHDYILRSGHTVADIAGDEGEAILENLTTWTPTFGTSDDPGGLPGSGELGEYWENWGALGPQGNPIVDDEGNVTGWDRGLTDIQEMVASAGLFAQDPDEYEDRLEHLETRFMNELFSGTDAEWQEAEDHWGLDLKRVTQSGEDLNFDTAVWTNDQVDDAFYATLTRGDIDWTFYRESNVYQEARKALGFQTDYREGETGIAMIRAANAWVHGQTATIIQDENGETLPPIVDWVPYEASFVAEEQPDFVPMEVEITDYTPPERRQVTTDITEITAPTINISSNPLRVPTNLEGYPVSTPGGSTND